MTDDPVLTAGKVAMRIVAALSDTYTLEGVRIWLNSYNLSLEGVPRDLIFTSDADAQRVVEYAEYIGGQGW